MAAASGTFSATSSSFGPPQQQRRRQFLAPPSILAQYGAKVVFPPNDNDDSSSSTTTAAAPAVVLGIALQGWNITTWQGTIANEEWLEQMIHECEACAQPYSFSTDHDQQQPSRRRRKLNVPEMVFGVAHVTLEQQQQQPLDDDDDQHGDDTRKGEHNESNRRLQLGWNAKQALMEWARAHESIPLPSCITDTSTKMATTIMQEESVETESTSSAPSKNHDHLETGVTILQSMDAALWRQKNGADPSAVLLPSLPISKDTATVVVHYDWTFSTPYSGHVQVVPNRHTNEEEEPQQSPQQQSPQQQEHHVIWKSLASSGIKLELLTDQSIPILYYDEIILLEDDLHDNGQVEYSVKLRVMPHCIYVLARLWLCVDQVVLRLRETRLLVEFMPDNKNNKSKRSFPRIHRDVTWRECAWKDLPKHSLPTSLAAWCGGGASGSTTTSSGRGATPSGVESPEFRARLAQLPLQPSLPANLSPHAVLVEQHRSTEE